jgi:sec-independent protein translocase protein TatB
MFDIGFSELLVIAVVALVVLGPERLPKAARCRLVGAPRPRQWNSVKDELERELAADELKRELQQARDALNRAESELHRADAQVRAGIDEVGRLPAAAAEAPAAPADAAANTDAATSTPHTPPAPWPKSIRPCLSPIRKAA